jgi:hypothetical protein
MNTSGYQAGRPAAAETRTSQRLCGRRVIRPRFPLLHPPSAEHPARARSSSRRPQRGPGLARTAPADLRLDLVPRAPAFATAFWLDRSMAPACPSSSARQRTTPKALPPTRSLHCPSHGADHRDPRGMLQHLSRLRALTELDPGVQPTDRSSDQQALRVEPRVANIAAAAQIGYFALSVGWSCRWPAGCLEHQPDVRGAGSPAGAVEHGKAGMPSWRRCCVGSPRRRIPRQQRHLPAARSPGEDPNRVLGLAHARPCRGRRPDHRGVRLGKSSVAAEITCQSGSWRSRRIC